VGVAITWAVVATLIAAECVFPVTTVRSSEVHPYEYVRNETSGVDIYPYIMTLKSNHRPVWLSDPSDILLGRIAFEMAALLLAGVAVSLLLSSKKKAQKGRTSWFIGMLLIASLCMFPPIRVYDSDATSRIVESRRTQKRQALEKLMKEQKTTTLVRHTISKGEMVWEIAEQYGISIQALVDANNLSKEKGLTVGQTLLIPVPNEFRIGDSVTQSKGQDKQRREASDMENEAKFLRILSPYEVVYRNIHTPVWTSGQEEIRYHQLGLEILAIVLVTVGATFFMLKKGDN
jgi:LysM repeat protein